MILRERTGDKRKGNNFMTHELIKKLLRNYSRCGAEDVNPHSGEFWFTQMGRLHESRSAFLFALAEE